jgi:hypothetical protein
MKKFALLAASLALTAPVDARVKSVTGEVDGFAVEVRSLIVGQTSTGTLAIGGDPIYLAPPSTYSGVVAIISTYAGVGSFICSGTLLPDRRSILTAAHCVSDGAGTPGPTTTTVWFRDSTTVDPFYTSGTPIGVTDIFVNPGYTGEVIDHNDIAILRLGAEAPAFTMSHYLSKVGDLTGVDFNVAGYGGRSSIGGAQGTTAGTGTGRIRQGDNRFEYRLGDADFNDLWNPLFSAAFGVTFTNIDYSWVSDFDNGLAANDAACLINTHPVFAGLGLGGPKFCNTGRGATEVSVAGGDSGGPQFDALGRLLSVTSYGMTFGPAYGDFRNGLQSSWGEWNGFVPTSLHRDWILSIVPNAVIPEPGTWAMLIAGFGMVGAAVRRRRETVAA